MRLIINAQTDDPVPPPPDDQVPLEDDGADMVGGIEDSVQPAGELEAPQGYDPAGMEYELVQPPPSKWEKENETLNVPSKIWFSMGNNEEHEQIPLRILYTTIKGHTTERTVHPDHVHWARGHSIMVAWCDLRGDWRAFIVDRISKAKLEG